MATIKLEQVSKVFEDHTAIAPFDLVIEDGEFLVLVGPSGCGKTTTLRILAGLEEPSSGHIFLDETDITDCEAKNRDMAMVFQNYALYPHMSVYDNMAYALKLRKVPKAQIEAAVKKTAAMLGLDALLRRYPRELSGGQQQRVALGRAIIRKPKVFLMDEPLSNLDAKLRVQTRAELIELHSKLKTTIVYVTHDQVEAMTMGTRIVLMKDGLIQQVGKPIELYKKPVNRFVAEFIGTPPMQFLSGKIQAKEAGDGFVFSGDGVTLELTGRYAENKDAVYLGVRPENFFISQKPGDNVFAAKVLVVENIGSEAIVHCAVGSEKIAIKIPVPQNLPSFGEKILVTPGKRSLYVFDKRTEKLAGILELSVS